MFGRGRQIRKGVTDTLIGNETTISGNLSFAGELAVMGTVHGNILAEDSSSSVVKLSESARVEGEIRVPNVLINGVVIGDVHATERVQLAKNARIHGSVYYHLIEMEMGAEVNGAMVHMDDHSDSRLSLGHEPPATRMLGSDGDLGLPEPADGDGGGLRPSESDGSEQSSLKESS